MPRPPDCSWLFVGGQAALDEDGKVVGAGNRAEQTELVMRYVAQVLGAAGACFDDVLKLNTYYCHSVGGGALQGGAEARSRRFSPPGPALSDVPVDELAYPGMLVEMEAIAAIGPRRGVDPTEGMLSVARSRSGAECVEWIHSKAEDLDVDRRFRTIYMTGHAFQALIDDETAVASLSAMAAHLKPDGMVLFETRNPLRRAWERWNSGEGNDTPVAFMCRERRD